MVDRGGSWSSRSLDRTETDQRHWTWKLAPVSPHFALSLLEITGRPLLLRRTPSISFDLSSLQIVQTSRVAGLSANTGWDDLPKSCQIFKTADPFELEDMSGAPARDGAEEPLIPDGLVNEELAPADDPAALLDQFAPSKPTLFVWLLTLSAGVSGLLFGFDTGVISSTLVSIHNDLSGRTLSTLDKSVITSATSLFALIASPCTGYIADALGRKRAILLASCLFIVGAVGQAFSRTVLEMVIGRAIVGSGVGAASFVVPLYIGELAPAEWRGRLVTISSLFITGGQVVAYIVGWLFSSMEGGWRWMVGLGAVPAALQLVMLIGMPETARWLVKVGRNAEAERVLEKVYGSRARRGGIVMKVLHAIQQEIREETAATGKAIGSSPLRDLFAIERNRRALSIACLLQGSQQLCGFNSLMYFSATIFALVGFSSPTLTSLTIAITNFFFTIIAFFSIDRVGRRRVLLFSIPWMVLGLLLCALAFSFIDLGASTDDPPVTDASPRWPALLLLLSLILYVATYALGLGNVPWQQSELFPLRVRSLGSSLSTATNWASNTIVGLTFLPMMDLLSPSITFTVYAAVCIGSWVGVWWCYPETAGLGLEEVGSLLDTGWGVEISVQRRKARIRAGGSVEPE